MRLRFPRLLRLVTLAVTSMCSTGCGGEKPTAPVTVASVSVTANTTTLTYGATAQLTASVIGSNGAPLSGRPVTWSSSNDAIATVSPTGMVTAGAVRGGTAEAVTITAASEGKSATTSISVAPIPVATVTPSLAQLSLYLGQTVQLGVTLKDALGGTLAGRSVTWSSATPTVATISQQGLVTAVALGSATMSAVVEGKTATVSVIVRNVPVASVRISPSTASLHVGQSQQFSATARDSAGNVLTGRAVTWSSASTALASISASGLATAIAPGDALLSATVEGISGTAVFTVRPQPTVQTTVRGNGFVILRNLRTARTDTVRDARSVACFAGDSLEIIPIAGPGALFDGVTGFVTDTMQLHRSYGVRVSADVPLDVRFVPRNGGNKILQNEFFDTTALDYRTSANFVVWWDKRWDHNYLAKYMLRQLEAVRVRGDAWGMRRPPGSDRVYLNAYIHHKTGDGVGNIDVFNDGWGQAVGTDRFGMPYYVAPMGTTRISLTEEFCWCFGSVWHEGFHLHQWASTNHPPLSFPFNRDHLWYIEATADWLEKYFTLSADNARLGGYATFNGTPAFLMQPQQSLWSSGNGITTWSRGVHTYAGHLLLLYLTWNKIIPEDFIGRSFARSSTISPQEYLYRNIPDFRNVYRRFATQIVVLDGVPAWAKTNITSAIEWWRTFGANAGNALPNGRNDDNTYAFDLKDRGTTGWVSPSEPLEAWAFSVTKLQVTQASSYRIAVTGSAAGSEGTPASLHVGLVFEKDGVSRYSEIPLTNFQGTLDSAVAANTNVYVVVVSTPERFTGAETFPYSIRIDKLP